jgi:hypothetical protein
MRKQQTTHKQISMWLTRDEYSQIYSLFKEKLISSDDKISFKQFLVDLILNKKAQ